jgi:hypothetical protein
VDLLNVFEEFFVLDISLARLPIQPVVVAAPGDIE